MESDGDNNNMQNIKGRGQQGNNIYLIAALPYVIIQKEQEQ